ncbi:PREDICTED: islet cell autoantigen 1 isoform X2 [Vollenhovia emeryi]|uniref:islet cell autoantigen 1 isoform X2 n=1 Tax=Vollenhovia emeryi TaxID=411798 RepID=UPI0005F43017|nr:PREDICTED: islet cell autoantigen 1 isoform X2 [Vollenhovia emeryi]
MNAYNKGAPGVSGNAFDCWVQKHDDSAIIKMQYQFWVRKQALSQKLGKKEDECIVASDAELDAKLELFRSIQDSCSYLQRVIDRYQERLCNLAQEENGMGRFLKDAGKQDKTRAGKMMSAVGKSLSYSGQQRLALRSPLGRLYQEVETFRQRAIEDTLQNVQAMEKARTEYRAALSWMKNISADLNPDASKQLEKYKKIQAHVKQGKIVFDNLALDCLQKVDLLAAARCNMFSHALVLYQTTLLNFTKKSAQAYATIANSFKGYQRYDFTVVRELAETSSKLAQETGGDDDLEDKDKLQFFDMDYHDDVEEAQEATANLGSASAKNKKEDKLLDIENEPKDTLIHLETTDSSRNGVVPSTKDTENDKSLEEFFGKLILEKDTSNSTEQSVNKSEKKNHTPFNKSSEGQKSVIDIFDECNADFNLADLSPLSSEARQQQQSLNLLASESAALFDEILNDKQPCTNNDWEGISHDTFLPPSILKQSLGDAALGMGQKSTTSNMDDKKKNKTGKQKGNSWLDLFAELDPLANNPMENLSGDSNASA